MAYINKDGIPCTETYVLAKSLAIIAENMITADEQLSDEQLSYGRLSDECAMLYAAAIREASERLSEQDAYIKYLEARLSKINNEKENSDDETIS